MARDRIEEAFDHEDKGYSEEKCVRCGWVMGHPPLNCQNDDTPHVFPSQFSRMSVGDRRLTWAEAARHWEDRARADGALRSILDDLDRCRHGRHHQDDCFGCGNLNEGNRFAPPGTRIGTDLAGRAIVIPESGRMRDPDAWITEAGP